MPSELHYSNWKLSENSRVAIGEITKNKIGERKMFTIKLKMYKRNIKLL